VHTQPMTDRAPLSALLSQALVALAIEFDNEFEHQMPHRTTNHGSTPGAAGAPWLVSMAMWVHCMRYVPEGGIAAGELVRRSRLGPKSGEMVIRRMSAWWGYLTVDTGRGSTGSRSSRSAWMVRPTHGGEQAHHIWSSLTALIDDRWRSRFGAGSIEQLRASLEPLVGQLGGWLLDYPPIGALSRVASSGQSRARRAPPPAQPVATTPGDLPLWALLSKALLAFAADVGQTNADPLPLSANVQRVLTETGVRVRELSALTGIAGFGITNSMVALTRTGHIEVGTDPAGGRAKVARLTSLGTESQLAYRQSTSQVEKDWEARFGAGLVGALRESLDELVGGVNSRESTLLDGVAPYPEGWRAQVPRPVTLPHFPMVSHRGGFPDGS